MFRSVGLGVVVAFLALTAVTSDGAPRRVPTIARTKVATTSPWVPPEPAEVPRSTDERREDAGAQQRLQLRHPRHSPVWRAPRRGVRREQQSSSLGTGDGPGPRGAPHLLRRRQVWTTAVRTARKDLRHNRVPWISFKLPYSWEEMRDGRGDDWARQLAARMSGLNGPVWLAFHHEPEGDGDIRAWTGMQARLAPIVRRAAPNVAYSIILTGWNQLYGNRQYSLDKMWPQDQDRPGRLRRLRQVRHTDRRPEAHPAHRLRARLLPQFRDFARRHKVAWGLSETGQTDRSAAVNPRWMERTYQSLSRHDGVALVLLQHHAEQHRALAAQGRQGAEVRHGAAQHADTLTSGDEAGQLLNRCWVSSRPSLTSDSTASAAVSTWSGSSLRSAAV